MNYSFQPEAEAELNHAVEYYEERETGLGYDFAVEVHNCVQNILLYPQAWNPLAEDIRLCLVNRFPYGLIYSQNGSEILILAVMHCHREPNYWHHRIK